MYKVSTVQLYIPIMYLMWNPGIPREIEPVPGRTPDPSSHAVTPSAKQ